MLTKSVRKKLDNNIFLHYHYGIRKVNNRTLDILKPHKPILF